MTPAQRKYDLELAASMRRQAERVLPRSRQVSDTLLTAADRIEALSAQVPVDPEQQIDHQGLAIQPASASGQPG